MNQQENPCDIYAVLMCGNSNHRTETKCRGYDIYVSLVELEIL